MQNIIFFSLPPAKTVEFVPYQVADNDSWN